MSRSLARILFVLTVAVLGALFLAPLGMVVAGGFRDGSGFTLKYLFGVFRNPIYSEGLWHSLLIALGTSGLVAAMAIPLAWIANRFDFAGKRVATALLLAPMILPPFVGAIGLQQMLGPYGAINELLGLGPVDWLGQSQYAGVVMLQALGLYPILYLNVSAALANIDPAMEEAASNIGCRPWRKFFRITLPLMMPGLFAGGTIVFIWSFTELGTPLIMNYTRCAPVQVFDALKEIGSNPFPYALVFTMLLASVSLFALSKFAFGRSAHAMQSKAATVSGARSLHGWRAAIALLPFALVITAALLPHLGVVFTSVAAPGSWYRTILPATFTGDHFAAALGHGMTIDSIRNSLFYSSLAVIFDALVGVAIAFVIVRSDVRGRGLLDMLAMLPLAVPGLVLAFGYLAISSHFSNQEWVKSSPFWQHLLDVRTNPTLFLVIAYSMRRLPYMVRSAVAGLQQTSVTLEEAAANLGAGFLTRMRRVTLPLIAANLIAGGLLAFAFSMLEVSDSIMLAQQAEFFPITKTIYELFQLIGDGKHIAAALGVWAMAMLGITIIGGSALMGRKLGALFRA